MQVVSITNPEDQSFPFTHEVFEDRTVLYHGTWSTYVPRIESEGLQSGNLTFDLAPFVSISEALRAIGGGSFFSAFGDGYVPFAESFAGRPPVRPRARAALDKR